MHHFIPISEFELETLNSGRNWQFFVPSDLEIWVIDGWPRKRIGHQFCVASSFAHHFKAMDELKLELQSGNAQYRSKLASFWSVWPWNLTDGLEQGKSEEFDSCDRPNNLTQIGFKSSINQAVKFDGWPWKARHLLYTTSSFVHHSKSISEFKQDLQSGNAPFGSKLVIFLSHTTLKNKRAHLLCYFKLCESFHSHLFKLELQSRNAKFGSKSAIFMPRVTLKFDRWPSKTIGHLFYATSSLVHHFIAIGQFKLGFQSGNPKFWSKSAIFCHVWPWYLTDDLEK